MDDLFLLLARPPLEVGPSFRRQHRPAGAAQILFGRRTPQRSDRALVKRAAVIKPAAEELRWQRIPWVMDLTEGQRLAKAEGRLIFLWVTGDDPLERC